MDHLRIGHGLRTPDMVAEKEQPTGAGTINFSDSLRNAIDHVNRLQHGADKAVMNVQGGNAGSLHEAMIALEKADIAFRTMLQVRNKLIEAYQEVMRMQV